MHGCLGYCVWSYCHCQELLSLGGDPFLPGSCRSVSTYYNQSCTFALDSGTSLTIPSPYFPGALFLLSTWYTRKELALRTSILYAGSLLAGGFGGLVGAGIQYGLDGVHGLSAWRWLFIIEAAVTVFIAILAMLILPDYPHTTRSFTPLERAIAINRMRHPSGQLDEERGSALKGLRMAVTDYKTWLLA